MKTYFKTFAFAAIATMLLFACKTNGDEETSSQLPLMDSRVVSYKMTRSCLACEEYLRYGIITDQDALKSLFPNILNDEQAEAKCNYFAIHSPNTSSTLVRYWLLSQDMILYEINSHSTCPVNDDIAYHVMLVCDDTEKGILKSKIDLNNIHSFTDKNWHCKEEKKDVFF